MPAQSLSTAAKRLTPVAGAPLWCDAREYGAAGDGVANDQPALAALVDTLGAAYAADGRARTIQCPAGTYSIRDAGTSGARGVADRAGTGAPPGCCPTRTGRDPTPLAYFTTRSTAPAGTTTSPTAPSRTSRSTAPA